MKDVKAKIYESIWRNKWITADCHSIPEMINQIRGAALYLEEMYNTGKITLINSEDISDDYAFFTTEDEAIAAKYNFHLQDDELEDIEDDGA
jgi:hypothetical protein